MTRKCPVCGKKLEQKDRSFICEKGHSFDVSSSGYVNLLMAQKGAAKNHGDTKEMVVARSRFLRQGYYQPLSDGINESLVSLFQGKKEATIVDAGCGEGYYTERVLKAFLDNGITATIQGYDVSKQAITSAAKSCKQISYGVASLFALPIMEGECDIVLNLFAPLCAEEFARVLKKDGVLVIVAPEAKHLWGLKCALYDQPYENQLSEREISGFELVKEQQISYHITVQGQENIQALFSMTPYYWKTSLKDKAKLECFDSLTTEVSFTILVYRRIS